MVMENRTRLFRVVRSIPYALVILCSIMGLVSVLPQIWYPVDGSYYYENILSAFMWFLLLCSLVAKGAMRSVLILISCASIFSLGLIGLLGKLREFAIHGPELQGRGPIVTDVWFDIVFLGLFFTVVVVEAVMLIRFRADQP